MTRKLALVITLVAAIAAAGGGIATPGKAAPPEAEAQFGSSFVPKTLPRERTAAIALSLWGMITAPGQSHPPALSQLDVDAEGMEFKVGNRPPCRPSGLQQRLDVAEMRKACRASILGTGRIEVEVEFPDQNPVAVKSELLVLNGENGTAPLIFGYLRSPVTGQLVIPMAVNKKSKRVAAHAAIPKIANGYGSVTYFRLDFKRGVFRANCPHGALGMSISGTFPTGRFATATFDRNRC